MQDRDPLAAAKDDTFAPAGMVQGVTEAKYMGSILERTEKFFADHDPGVFMFASVRYRAQILEYPASVQNM